MSFSTDPATKRNPGSGKSLAASTMAISFSSVGSLARWIFIHGGTMCSTAMSMPLEPLQSSSRMRTTLRSSSPGSFCAPGQCDTSFHLLRPRARKHCWKFWSLLLSEWKLSKRLFRRKRWNKPQMNADKRGFLGSVSRTVLSRRESALIRGLSGSYQVHRGGILRILCVVVKTPASFAAVQTGHHHAFQKWRRRKAFLPKLIEHDLGDVVRRVESYEIAERQGTHGIAAAEL